MGLTIPNLDRYDFETLKKEAMAKLPAYSSRWTEYNASDPGVTILELLAWMADINSYRLNHLGEEHYLAFLSLLNAKKEIEEEDEDKDEDEDETEHHSEQHIQEAFLALCEELSIPSKAVTLQDYEYLAKETPDVDLAKVKAEAYREENKVSVLIVPSPSSKKNNPKEKVRDFLNDKKLLTTRLEVVDDVSYVPVNVTLRLQTRFADPDLLRSEIETLLETFLHPLYGGVEGKGWGFGEDVHVSHIYLLLKQLKEIEKIESIYFSSNHAVTVAIPAMHLLKSGRHQVTVNSIKVLGVCL